MSIDALTQAWSEALSQNSDQLGPAAMSFLRSAKPLGDIDGTILIAVPNDFAKKWIENNGANDLTQALAAILGRSVRLAVTIDPTLDAQEEAVEESSSTASEIADNSAPTSQAEPALLLRLFHSSAKPPAAREAHNWQSIPPARISIPSTLLTPSSLVLRTASLTLQLLRYRKARDVPTTRCSFTVVPGWGRPT